MGGVPIGVAGGPDPIARRSPVRPPLFRCYMTVSYIR